jgi:hypothetical protein
LKRLAVFTSLSWKKKKKKKKKKKTKADSSSTLRDKYSHA